MIESLSEIIKNMSGKFDSISVSQVLYGLQRMSSDSKEIRKRMDIPIGTEIESLIVNEIVDIDEKPIIKSKIINKV